MTRRAKALVVVLGLVGVMVALRPPEASACTCASPAPGAPHPAVVVEGRAVEQTGGTTPDTSDPGTPRPSGWSLEWRFLVDGVARGPVASGDEISVEMMQGDGASCGIDAPALEPGRRYRVGGSYDDPSQTLHLNSCSGGFVEELGDAPPPAPPPPSVVTAPPIGPPPTATAVTTTTPTEETLVAIVDDGTDGGGVDGRLAGAAAVGIAGAGVGLAALWRSRRPFPG